jgi:hypothetical protein
MAAVLSDDWRRMYSHPIYFAETFLDPGRFRGTCYRAANWQLLGLTTGRGKNDQTHKPNRPISVPSEDAGNAGAVRRSRVAGSNRVGDGATAL